MKKKVVLSENGGAHFPENATKFERKDWAEEAAKKAVKNKTWRVDSMAIRGEPYFVIKFWPIGSPESCAERRWAIIRKQRPRKKAECGEDH